MVCPEIAVIDYGMGNLRSVGKALEFAGADVIVTSSPRSIASAAAVVLPGVGSFGPAVRFLRARRLEEAVHRVIESGKPFLGLCLGFQLLFSTSEEEGRHRGLDIVPGKVVRFDFSSLPKRRRTPLKVPHMGWNRVKVQTAEAGQRMFRGIGDNAYFYFVHSYYGVPEETPAVAGQSNYGFSFCSAVIKGRVWACQFHPEKSGASGLRLLKNFVQEARQ